MRPLPTEREIIERLKRELGDKIIRLQLAERELAEAKFDAKYWCRKYNAKCVQALGDIKTVRTKLKAYKAYVKQLTGRDSLPKPHEDHRN